MPFFAWTVFVIAAVLEVGGDAVIRRGLIGRRPAIVVLGLATVATYGLVVNIVRWDFSKLLGVYVAIFAVLSVCVGRFFFREMVPPSTWIGMAIIAIGGLCIQFGS